MSDSDPCALQLRYTQHQNVKCEVLQTDSKGHAIGLYVEKGKFFMYYIAEPTAMGGGGPPPPPPPLPGYTTVGILIFTPYTALDFEMVWVRA